MSRSLKAAALAVLLVALLMATCFSTGSGSGPIAPVKAESSTANEESPLSSLAVSFSQSKQFQAGTVFHNLSYSIGVDPLAQDLALGDLNHDGLSDVAVISKQTNDICIYNRSSNGVVSDHPCKLSRSDIVDMRSIAIGDMNKDGLNDIVVNYNDTDGNGRVAIFYQSSAYPFFNTTIKELALGDLEPYQVVIGKFDGTSNECIATVCMNSQALSDDSIVIWKYPFGSALNDRYKIAVPAFTKSKFLVAGTINGDDLEDLVVGNSGGSNVWIAYQTATWGTWSLSSQTISGSASDIQLADVTGDDRNDLIFADTSNAGGYSTVRIYPNDGSGFSANPTHAPLKTCLGLGTMAAGNLSSDPRTDLIVLSNGYSNASVYLQNGQGFIGQYSNLTFPVDESPLKAIVDDSIPGHRGVFVLSQGPAGKNGTLGWYSTNSTTGNADANHFAGADRPTTLATGVLANGDVIVASTLAASNKVLVFDQKSNLSGTLLTQNGPIAAVLGKFSSPTEDDLAVLNSVSHSISLYHGSKLFTNSQPYKNLTLPISGPVSLSAQSIRGNGYDDLLVGSAQGCYILYSTMDGQAFDLVHNESLGGAIPGARTAILVADFNGDGVPGDVALLNAATDQVEIYPRKATGSAGSYYLHLPNSYLNTSEPMLSIASGDFGGSSAQDVAAITQNGYLLVFLQPDYGFIDIPYNPELQVHLAGKPVSLSAGDLNDDGLTDIVIGYGDSPRLAAYLRTGSGSFMCAFNLTTGAASSAVMAQDLNGDGRTDICCASPGSRSLSVWFQNDLAPVAVEAGPASQYKGLDIVFSGASSQDSYSDLGSLNYTWTFGDGSTGYGASVSHRYANAAAYNVRLTVRDRTGLQSSALASVNILQTYPSAALSVSPGSAEEGAWLFFNDTSRPSSVSNAPLRLWQWEFDGSPGNTSENARQRFAAGMHSVRLSVMDADGVLNSTPLTYFNVAQVPPSAGFRSTFAKVGSPVYFNSTSTFAWTPIVGYRWDFGDGNTTVGSSPAVSHTFILKGWYTVALNVTDGQGHSDVSTRSIYVNATPPTATLGLSGQSEEGSVTRFAVSTFAYNRIESWNWSYDNSTWHLYHDAVSGASYTFVKNGSYWVTLNVTEQDGSWSVVRTLVVVQDTGPEITGLWTPAGTSCDMDQNVSIWASATPGYRPITKYEWNFDYGSGGTWIASIPSLANHTSWRFIQPGIHYVKVRVWDDDGYTECSDWLEVQVNDPAPVAHFSAQNSTQTSGVVLFDATLSTDTPSDVASLRYTWNFGDQSGWTFPSAGNRTLSHDFARDGRYNITLMVRDQWGSGSALVQAIVLVDRTPPSVVLEATGGNASAGQAIMVSVRVTDLFGVRTVVLQYRTNDGDWASIPMTPMNGPDTFYGQMPAQAAGTNVSYQIVATDANNNSYSTQTYQLNIRAAPTSGTATDYMALLAIVAAAVAVLLLLIYRALVPVDEVFIIYQDGQLMAHQTRHIKPGMDDDILASMFVAIQMFVKDSFKDESSTSLNRLDFGEKKILVERGESFYLAVVLHSNRTGSVPQRMQTVIADIQLNYGAALKGWDGDLEKVRGVKDSVDPLVKHKMLFGKK